jgi:hypothetical protein
MPILKTIKLYVDLENENIFKTVILKSINLYFMFKANKLLCCPYVLLKNAPYTYKPAQHAGTARCIFENALYMYI